MQNKCNFVGSPFVLTLIFMYANVVLDQVGGKSVNGDVRVGYSPGSKPLVTQRYLLEQTPGKGRCFSSSMRQIPRARFILYLYSCLFIPVQPGASQMHTKAARDKHLPPRGLAREQILMEWDQHWGELVWFNGEKTVFDGVLCTSRIQFNSFLF